MTNGGTKVTEFYLLGEDGLRIVGEVENIGPGLSRDLVVARRAGRATSPPASRAWSATASAPTSPSPTPARTSRPRADDKALVDQANANYQAYVKDQTEQLVAKTQEFVDLYKAGKDDEARALYARARVHWERIETVAESFGDLDPKMDTREADLEPGQKWTGWHRIEKDLWPARAEDYTAADRRGAREVRRRPAGQHQHPVRAGRTS